MSSETHQQDASHGINHATLVEQPESNMGKARAMAEPANGPPSYTEASRDAPVQQHPPPQQPIPQQYPMSQQPMSNPYPLQQPMNPNFAPVTPLHHLGETEAWIDCPFCHRRTRTRVDKADSSMTYILGLLLCLICICAACIPCLAHWCADIDHYCSECKQRVTHRPYNGNIEVLGEYGPATMPSRYAQASAMEMGAGHGQAGGGQQNVLQKPAPTHSGA
ncbi:hypothetical protein D0869_09557 [Hortaea werneckii]|uniref:LITAF domain-containing protein n=1 Tax=Hortaea werneckii TaxID=91943 RepID=A0A3M6WH88_HORWE|nr:hypothetical protein D0869_09557 [Hortaea werneckii]